MTRAPFDELVHRINNLLGTIEIQAEAATGFDDGLQRAVKENCNVLKFKNAEFEAGE